MVGSPGEAQGILRAGAHEASPGRRHGGECFVPAKEKTVQSNPIPVAGPATLSNASIGPPQSQAETSRKRNQSWVHNERTGTRNETTLTRSDASGLNEGPDERTRGRRRLTRRPWRARSGAESAVGRRARRRTPQSRRHCAERPTTRRGPAGGCDGVRGGRRLQREGQPRARGRRRAQLRLESQRRAAQRRQQQQAYLERAARGSERADTDSQESKRGARQTAAAARE